MAIGKLLIGATTSTETHHVEENISPERRNAMNSTNAVDNNSNDDNDNDDDDDDDGSSTKMVGPSQSFCIESPAIFVLSLVDPVSKRDFQDILFPPKPVLLRISFGTCSSLCCQ